MSEPDKKQELCDQCGKSATVIRLISTKSGYNPGPDWRVSLCDEHNYDPRRPQIKNKKLLDKIGRLILDECGNYELMESVIAFLSPQSKIENRKAKIL